MLTNIKLLVGFLRGKSPAKLAIAIIKAIAEGKLGDGPRELYWKLAGVKTWITVVLAGAWSVLWLLSDASLCAQCDQWAGTVGTAAVFLAAVGLWDASVRAEPPRR